MTETKSDIRVRDLLHRGEVENAWSAADVELRRLAHVGNITEVWKLRLLRAEILTIQGRVQEALEYLESFPPPCAGDSESTGSLKMQRGYCSGILGRTSVSHSLLVEAERLARDAGCLSLLGEILLCRAFIFFREKEYESSRDLYRSALDLSQEIEDWYVRGHGFWGIGKNHMIQCRYEDAMPLLEQSLRIFEAQNARLSVSTVWSELAVCYLGLGDDQKAMELLQMSERVDLEAGLMHSYQIDLANIGNVYLYRRDYFTALAYYQRAVSLARQIKDPVSVKKWTYNINLAYARIRAQIDQEYPRPAA